MRLDKLIANAGLASRSEISKAVRGGRVTVNGTTYNVVSVGATAFSGCISLTEVTLPEGEYSAFSFFITSIRNNTQNFPAVMEITYVSESIAELQQAVLDTTVFNPLTGTVPGFYNVDLTAFNAAIAEGQALLEQNAPSESALQAAIAKIRNEKAKIEEVGIMMPEAGKVYRVVSGEDGFMPNQNVQKALTIREEADYGQVLWWETASADSAQQEFTLEAMPECGENYYAFKNVKSDLYLGEYFNEENVRITNKFVLTEEKTPFLLKHLGDGQFAILREGNDREWFHALDHNQGVAAPSVNPQGAGGIKGVTSSIITWVGGANDPHHGCSANCRSSPSMPRASQI